MRSNTTAWAAIRHLEEAGLTLLPARDQCCTGLHHVVSEGRVDLSPQVEGRTRHHMTAGDRLKAAEMLAAAGTALEAIGWRQRDTFPGGTSFEDGTAPLVTAERARELNRAAFLEGDSDTPAIRVAGAAVHAFVDAERGQIVVSVHLDTDKIPADLISPDETVPLLVTVGDREVFNER
jgi:hypothetical protein